MNKLISAQKLLFSNKLFSICKFNFSQEENQFKDFKPTILDPVRLDYFKTLRIYSEDSIGMLINRYLICKFLKFGSLVKNANKIYNFSSKILGQKIPDTIMKWTIGKVFTGGDLMDHNINYTKQLDPKKIKVIFDYCCEAQPDLAGELLLDRNADVILQSVYAKKDVAKIQNKKEQDVQHICCLKVTGLCDYHTLKEWNKQTEKVWKIFAQLDIQKQGKLTGSQILDGLNSFGYQVSEAEVMSFLKDILKKDIQNKKLSDITVSKLEWRIYVHALYLEEIQNNNPVALKLVNFTKEQRTKLQNYNRRVEKIMNAASNNESRVLFDAEQTYVQSAIDSHTELVQMKYNKKLPLAVNTFQNYLKSSKERIDYEIEKYHYLKHIVALKMVRGAYMTEEREIATKNNQESPICNIKEDTDKIMDYNCLRLLETLKAPSQLFVGSHNENTIEKLMVQMKKLKIQQDNVIFSQLKGLADHISFSLGQLGYNVFKFSPYGEPHILIPYLLRRSEEQYLMFGIVRLQEKLILDEFMKRTFFSS